MKLNIGCGEFYADGWVNIDVVSNEQVHPDIIGSLLQLPPPAELSNVEMVYLGHILEHIPYSQVPQALTLLWRRCVAGARVAIVGPDVDRAGALHAANQLDWHTVTGALCGELRWPGDEHQWMCTETRLARVVKASGLKRVHTVPIASQLLDNFPVSSRAPWQCAIVGVAG